MSAARLLVVDDDARYAASVCELLRLDGHSVAFEVDGVRALERIRSDDIAVLILDLDMPRVSGLDVLQALATRIGCLKTIVVSGVSDIENIAPALRFGPFDYLAKPYDPRHLLASVRDALTSIARERESLAAFADQAVGRLTRGIAHDFNNILADIIGHTELSLGSVTGTGHMKEVLAAGQRARDLISQILLLTRHDRIDAVAATAGSMGHIVVVDYEVSVATCISDVLKSAGYDVVVFNDTAAAFDHIVTAGPGIALVLIDQVLPQLTGAQFAKRVRENADAPPIVIMAGYADRAERYCTPVLNKPFRVAELLDAVTTTARRTAVQ
jgi:DNA-binding NtrC family response regulator